MNDQRALELIQSVLDDAATPAEAAELETLTRHSPAARAALESFRSLYRELERSGDVRPPERMREEILDMLRARSASTEPVVIEAGGRFARRRWIVGSLAAAAVLAIVLAAPFIRRTTDASSDRLQGAMVPAGWTEVASAEADGEGMAVLLRQGSTLRLQASRQSDGVIDVSWDSQRLILEGSSADGVLRVHCPEGQCPALTFRSTAPEARIGVSFPGGRRLELTAMAP